MPDATRHSPAPDSFQRAARRATEAILAQLVDAFEGARLAQGLSVTQVARRAHVSKRSIGLAKAGAVVPSLQTLVAWAEACGLELEIRVRQKRTGRDQGAERVEDAPQSEKTAGVYA